MMALPTHYDTAIRQGGKFQLNVAAKNLDNSVKDLTGYDARMQVRETIDSTVVLLEATTGNGRITINGPGGIVMVLVGADITSALTFNTAKYDLEAYKIGDPSDVIPLAEGNISLHPEVTR
jgi:hypothetical protein